MCAIDKAPGPDGFTIDFFVQCQEVVKGDIMKAFENLYDQEVFKRNQNATFITVIPKEKCAKE